MTQHDAAIEYTKLGLAVFPIQYKGKKPLTEHGCKDATTDAEQVDKWWSKWPNANIGIATGKRSGGVYVIDLDIDDDRGIDGYHSFEDWQREHHVTFPDSWMVITGRGGYHIYMRSKKIVQNRVGLLDGVDIRGEGGYVVAPPSTHANGHKYEWEYSPEDLPIAMADELLEALTQQTANFERPDNSFQIPDRIKKGERNDVLFKAACSYQSKGLPDESIYAAVMALNESRCDTSLSDDEVKRLVDSALQRYDKGKKPPAAVDDLQVEGVTLRSGKHGPLQITTNIVEVLDHDPALQGIIKYNELTYTPFIQGKLPWSDKDEYRDWTNIDDSNLYAYVEDNYGLTNRTKMAEALDIVSHKNLYNPVKEMLELIHAQQWDGKTGHIENLLPDYMGVEKNEYTIECMKLLMLGAISRIYYPGCKFDYMPVLVGRQGIGKSTFFKYLALSENWYDDNFNTVEGDKAAERLRGIWIAEMAELLATKRAKDIEAIKSFLTSTADNYRPPYERRTEHRQRMCVFVGTTNSDQFLTDRTGNRRFLPMVAREDYIMKDLFGDSAAVNADFINAWGEAMDLFKQANGRPSLILSKDAAKLAQQEQETFTEEDTRVGIIQNWLDTTPHHRVCTRMVYDEALNSSTPPTKRDTNEIAAIMNNEIVGWERLPGKLKCGKYGSVRCYERVAKNSNSDGNSDDGFIDAPDDIDDLFK